EPVRVAHVSARGGARWGRALDRRHVPCGAHRTALGAPRRADLGRGRVASEGDGTAKKGKSRFSRTLAADRPRRLAPDEWFPAGVDGIRVRRIVLPSGNGLRMLEAGTKSHAPPLLLMHGWAVSSYLWRHNILPLAAAGHRVI